MKCYYNRNVLSNVRMLCITSSKLNERETCNYHNYCAYFEQFLSLFDLVMILLCCSAYSG